MPDPILQASGMPPTCTMSDTFYVLVGSEELAADILDDYTQYPLMLWGLPRAATVTLFAGEDVP